MMKDFSKKRAICFFCLILIMWVQHANAMESGEIAIVKKPNNLNAEALFLVSSDDGKILPIKVANWGLEIKEVCQPNKSIDQQLNIHGLVANGDSKSLVLHYNQKIALDNLEGSLGCYWLPSVVRNSANSEKIERGFLLRVSAFPERKKQLWKATDELYNTLGISSHSITILTSETLFEPMLTLVKNHHALMTTIDSNNVLIPVEIIEESLAELELLQMLINKAIDNVEKTSQENVSPMLAGQLDLSPEELTNINTIAQSVSSRAAAYQEMFGSFVNSIVRTKVWLTVKLLNVKGAELSNYEVFIVPKALVDVQRFHRSIGLTSPAKGTISAGNYMVWAVQFTAQGQKVVSNYRDLSIDDLAIQASALNLLFIEDQ